MRELRRLREWLELQPLRPDLEQLRATASRARTGSEHVLVVHAADDPVCPPSEMDVLFEITEENPNVAVWMLPAGNHCLFRYVDKNWYDAVTRGYFSYWAEWE